MLLGVNEMQVEQSELQQILESIQEIKTDVDAKIDTFNEKFDNYQKSTQQVVNLAFSLIASATILSIVYRVFPR
jgi:predicted PurR-regulated permease PerM